MGSLVGFIAKRSFKSVIKLINLLHKYKVIEKNVLLPITITNSTLAHTFNLSIFNLFTNYSTFRKTGVACT